MWRVECGVLSAAPATQKWRQRSLKWCAVHKNCNSSGEKNCAWPTKRFSIDYQTGWNVCHQVPSSTQNSMTTCLENLGKERFYIFPRWYGEATGKWEKRDEKGGNTIANISCGSSATFLSHFEATQMDKFYNFPHRHSEATREETGGSPKASRALRARFPPISIVGNINILKMWIFLPFPL